MDTGTYHPHFHVSLSARRAWIEIYDVWADTDYNLVALRKESVDRNRPSIKNRPSVSVALRKESVDRNTFFQVCIVTGRCRSPQGERG